MKWEELNKYVLSQYGDAELLFDLDNCCLEESAIVDQIDNYGEAEQAQVISDYESLGCIIRHNDIIFPKGVPFTLKLAPKNDPCVYYIHRKGEDIGVYYPDELIVNIDYTDIGRKCLLVAHDLDVTLDYAGIFKAYEHILSIESIFGVTIIKE